MHGLFSFDATRLIKSLSINKRVFAVKKLTLQSSYSDIRPVLTPLYKP
jgi:hypothetical protein